MNTTIKIYIAKDGVELRCASVNEGASMEITSGEFVAKTSKYLGYSIKRCNSYITLKQGQARWILGQDSLSVVVADEWKVRLELTKEQRADIKEVFSDIIY